MYFPDGMEKNLYFQDQRIKIIYVFEKGKIKDIYFVKLGKSLSAYLYVCMLKYYVLWVMGNFN